MSVLSEIKMLGVVLSTARHIHLVRSWLLHCSVANIDRSVHLPYTKVISLRFSLETRGKCTIIGALKLRILTIRLLTSFNNLKVLGKV